MNVRYKKTRDLTIVSLAVSVIVKGRDVGWPGGRNWDKAGIFSFF